jgi:hypothetical protein
MVLTVEQPLLGVNLTESFKIGRRRVWKKSTVLAWIADQEAATS